MYWIPSEFHHGVTISLEKMLDTYLVFYHATELSCCYKWLRKKLLEIEVSLEKVKERRDKSSCQEAYILINNYSAGIYLIKVNNRNTRIRCEICSSLTIKIPEWRHWRRSLLTLNIFTPCYSVSIVNFEHVNAAWVESYLGPTQASISPESSIKDVCKVLNTSITHIMYSFY